MFDSNKLYITDIETDNLDFKKGSIVEIGIVQLDLKTKEILPMFSSIVREPKRINKEAWIFKNSDLTYYEVKTASPLFLLKKVIQQIFYLGYNTGYNYNFDFTYLEAKGFIIPNRWFDPMKILTPIMQLPHEYYGFKYPKVEEAYQFLFGCFIKEPHRALQDAIIEAKIIKKILEKSYECSFERWFDK